MTVDLLIRNANVVTIDPNLPSASAVAVRGDKILWVGDDADAPDVGTPAKTIDAGGATVLPGFNEAHNHLMLLGYWLSQLNCAYPAVKSINDIVRAVAEKTETTYEGKWIEGRGYDDNKLSDRRKLTRWDLDAVSPDHPVMIRNASGHMCVVNSHALRVSGITGSTPDPQGGHIVTDENGEPTGLLQETAQSLLPLKFIPEDPAALRECLDRASDAYLAAGVTSTQEAGIFSTPEFGVYQDAWNAGELKMRIYMMIRTNFIESLEHLGLRTGFGDNRLRVGCLKIMADGSLIGRTAAVSQPFLNDPEAANLGLMMMPDEDLYEMIWRGHSRGWQVAIHAIGDRGIELCLNGYERALKRMPRKDARHRLEHCGILRPDLIARIKELGVLPIPQPPFILEFGDGFMRHLGEERAQFTYMMKSLLDFGIPVAGSSDSPVSSYQPLLGIKAAVTEKTSSGQIFAPNEAVTVDQALHMYTRAGAYASFEEKIKGAIIPGMLADFAILRDDPRTVDPMTIDQIPVLSTISGGRVLYERAMAGA